MSNASHAGKGDRPRKVDRAKFENNWSNIFGKKEDSICEPELTDTERKLKEWGMMYDCLQNMHLYEYPIEEVKQLLKQIRTK